MAKRSRSPRSKSSHEMLLLVLIGFLLLVVSYFMFFSNNENVQGVKDYRPEVARIANDATKAGKIRACIKNSTVSSFSLTSPCENKEKDGFSKAAYTCSDGNMGTIEKGCIGAPTALAQAKLACARAICPTPSPRPTK